MEDNYKDIFRKHFDTHEDEIDPQLIWDKVKPKKKKRFTWIFLVPIALGILVFAFIFQRNEKAIEVGQSQVGIETGLVEKDEDVMADSASQISENLNQKKRGPESKSILEEKNDALVKSPFTEVKKKKIREANRSKKVQGEKDREQTIFTKAEKSEEAPESIFTEVKKIAERAEEIFTEVKDNNGSKLSAEIVELEKETLKTKDLGKTENLDKEIKSSIVRLPKVSMGKFVVADREKEDLRISFAKLKKFQIVESPENSVQSFWSLATNVNYGFLNSDTKSETDFAAYKQTRIETVDQLEAVRANILASYHLGQRISFTSGIQYTRLNELFTWRGSYVEPVEGEYIESIEITNSDTIYTLRDGQYLEKKVRNMKIYNKTNLISVPLVLNYTHTVNKFSLVLSGGIEANIFEWSDGYILNEEGVPTTLKSHESNFGLNYLASVALAYQLTDQLSLSANVSSVFLNNQEENLSTDYRITGVGLGLQYRLK